MANYISGHKIIEQRVNELQREMDSLKSAVPSYDVTKASTYGQGLVNLRNDYAKGNANLQPKLVKADGSSIVRPLTFEETIDARVNAYESGNKELFKTWLDSSSGIVYDGTSKFKIINLSEELVTLPEEFNNGFLVSNYENSKGQPLDRNNSKYNTLLTKSEVLKHPAWKEAVSDKSLLKAYRDIVFKELKCDEAMGFWLRNEPTKDSLRALAVGNLDGSSGAFGGSDLDNGARFVRVAQK